MKLRAFIAALFALGLGIGVGSVTSARDGFRLLGQPAPGKPFVIKQGDTTVGRFQIPPSAKVFFGDSEVRIVGLKELTVEYEK
jgi:hypothetical protein